MEKREINYKSVPKIVIPTKYYPVIEDVPEYDLGKVFKMLFVYCMKDEQLQYRYQQMFEMYNADPHIRQLFKIFQITLDDQIAKYAAICERNAKNGLKGGRPRTGGLTRKEINAVQDIVDAYMLDKKSVQNRLADNKEQEHTQPSEHKHIPEPVPSPVTPKRDNKKNNDVEITPYPTPFFYENYPSISNATYWDYQVS